MKKQRYHAIERLFPLLTFFFYVFSMLAVVSLGVQVYRSVIEQLEHHDTTRTAQAYIMEKVRQHPDADDVSAGMIEGHSALCLEEKIDGTEYVTYIYVQNEMLTELFTRKNHMLSAESGTELLRMNAFSVQETPDGYLEMTITDDEKNVRKFCLYKRGDER